MMIIRAALAGALAFGFLAPALTTEAQQTSKVSRVGFLSGGSAQSSAVFLEAFRQRLHELGLDDRRNIIIESRFADGHMDRLGALAGELVRLDVAVIIAGPSTVAQAARQTTAAIPIVMVGVGDPIGLGFARSLSHPAGNMTGLASYLPELAAKSLQLLTEALPGLTRAAASLNPSNPLHEPAFQEENKTASSLGVQLLPMRAREPNEFAPLFAAMVKARVGAVAIYGDPVFARHRARLVELALTSRLPTRFTGRPDVEAGGLMAYGPDYLDLNRRAAVYVDKILKGAKPGDLPIEQPSTFQLVINLKTAKALGLTVPPTLLLKADEVIQ